MTRRLIKLEVDGPTFALRGWKAHGLALGAGLRPTFSGVRQAWIADTTRLPDLVSYLQYRNVAVEIIDTPSSRAGAEDDDLQVVPQVAGGDFSPPEADASGDTRSITSGPGVSPVTPGADAPGDLADARSDRDVRRGDDQGQRLGLSQSFGQDGERDVRRTDALGSDRFCNVDEISTAEVIGGASSRSDSDQLDLFSGDA